MSDEFVKSTCTNCGGRIEHPKTALGMAVNCPHCNLSTQLGSVHAPAAPPPASARPVPAATPKNRSVLRYALIAIPILALLAGGVIWSIMNRPKGGRPVVQNQSANSNAAVEPVLAPKSPDDLKAGPVNIDRSKGSRLIYAVGVITNQSDHPRLGVKVELALFDDGGKRLSAATDYAQLIEPRREWRYRALIIDSSAARAEVASIKEED